MMSRAPRTISNVTRSTSLKKKPVRIGPPRNPLYAKNSLFSSFRKPDIITLRLDLYRTLTNRSNSDTLRNRMSQ